MSGRTKLKNKPGRPKGTPKTGGRKLGTPNKGNVRLRDRFAELGFDFAQETVTVYDNLMPSEKAGFLLKLAPFFMQRLREDVAPAAPKPDENPIQPTDSPEEDLSQIPTAQLLQQLAKPQGPGGSN